MNYLKSFCLFEKEIIGGIRLKNQLNLLDGIPKSPNLIIPIKFKEKYFLDQTPYILRGLIK